MPYKNKADKAAWQKEYQKKWRDDNLEHTKEYNKKWNDKNRELRLLYGAKYRAEKRGTSCTITVNDITIPEFCPVFKVPLVRNSDKMNSDSATLDEFIHGKGYTPDNIVVMSQKANKMKNDASPEELLMFADWVYETFGGYRES